VTGAPGGAPDDRVFDRAEAVRRFGPGRTDTVVFTNGCFDLLHAGHVSLLERARALGDRLIVGLNSDASVRRLKGPDRPIVGGVDRARLLAALRAVDGVTIFEEDTPLELVKALLPDVLVKGADYVRADVVGGDEVEAAGGRVVLLPLADAPSTTELVRRLRS
jgi:D-beta-D-heptose 7-phosphate kinase/D-beta-D-heptose 1-phosphate adenosyltransferase